MSDDQDGCECVNVSSGTSLPGVVLDQRTLNACVWACVFSSSLVPEESTFREK